MWAELGPWTDNLKSCDAQRYSYFVALRLQPQLIVIILDGDLKAMLTLRRRLGLLRLLLLLLWLALKHVVLTLKMTRTNELDMQEMKASVSSCWKTIEVHRSDTNALNEPFQADNLPSSA